MSAATLKRKIHLGCRQLGLDSDTRHALQLRVTGRASLTEMTEAELQRVVDALSAQGFRATCKPGRGSRPKAKRADVRFAHVLWRLLAEAGAVKKPGPAGLNAFIRTRFGRSWGSVPIDIDAMTDHKQIADVVEALRSMCERAGIPSKKERRP